MRVRSARGATVAASAWALCIALFALLGPGRAPPVHVQISGGPTEGISILGWKVRVLRGAPGHEIACGAGRALSVTAAANGASRTFTDFREQDGTLNAVLGYERPIAGPVSVQVEQTPGRALASGTVWLYPAAWDARQRRSPMMS